jgi:cell division protein FtsB
MSEATEKKMRLAAALAKIEQLEADNEELTEENDDLQGRLNTIYREASPNDDLEEEEEEEDYDDPE